MHNTMKIAKWEIKRNLKNKTFLVGLFLTPIIFLGFMLLGSFFGGSDEDDTATQVFVNDQLNIFPMLEETVEQSGFNWELNQTDLAEDTIAGELEDSENTAYIFIDNRAMDEGVVPVYTSEEISSAFTSQVQVLEGPIQSLQMAELGLTEEELAVISQGVSFEETTTEELNTEDGGTEEAETAFGANFIERIVPGAFAGIIMFSIVMTGMAIFQSASQEKKDKIAEILLSSVTPGELMQGKVIGYFVLGIIQVIVFMVFILPYIIWRVDIPIIEYLLVPETILFVGIAILSYLLFAAIFVGIGATMSDVSTAGNFQGFVMMLPFAAFIFIGPVLNDPSGIWAQVGTYIPFTSPGVLLLRLTVLEEWPWVEIIISLVILVISIWIAMKLAGKIFKVGILLYGKNATPGEIWKWIRA